MGLHEFVDSGRFRTVATGRHVTTAGVLKRRMPGNPDTLIAKLAVRVSG